MSVYSNERALKRTTLMRLLYAIKSQRRKAIGTNPLVQYSFSTSKIGISLLKTIARTYLRLYE